MLRVGAGGTPFPMVDLTSEGVGSSWGAEYGIATKDLDLSVVPVIVGAELRLNGAVDEVVSKEEVDVFEPIEGHGDGSSEVVGLEVNVVRSALVRVFQEVCRDDAGELVLRKVYICEVRIGLEGGDRAGEPGILGFCLIEEGNGTKVLEAGNLSGYGASECVVSHGEVSEVGHFSDGGGERTSESVAIPVESVQMHEISDRFSQLSSEIALGEIQLLKVFQIIQFFRQVSSPELVPSHVQLGQRLRRANSRQ